MIIDDDKVACFVDVESSDYSVSSSSDSDYEDDHHHHSSSSDYSDSDHDHYDDHHHHHGDKHHHDKHIDKYDSHEKALVKTNIKLNPFKQSKKKSFKHEVGYKSTKASSHKSALDKKVDSIFDNFE